VGLVENKEREPDLQGYLHHILLIDLLQLLSLSGQTGVLELRQGWNTRSIYFQEGRLVAISLGTRPMTLGELLIKAGWLTTQQVEFLVQRTRQSGQPFRGLLVESGLVSEDDLRTRSEHQMEEAIYSLFLWRDCQFRFYWGQPEGVDLERTLPVDVSSERLIMEGARRVDEWSHLSPLIPSLRLVFHPTSQVELIAPPRLEALGNRDRRVLILLDGRSDVLALAGRSGLNRLEVMRSLAVLVRAGLARTSLPSKPQIIELFTLMLETIYKKLILFGHKALAHQFEEELNAFSRLNALKVRLYTGAVTLTDLDTPLESTALIDRYKLFMNVQLNYFSKTLPPEIAQGLLQGLYNHTSPELQELLRLYDFYSPDGAVAYEPFIE
jgi:hypothetical protein